MGSSGGLFFCVFFSFCGFGVVLMELQNDIPQQAQLRNRRKRKTHKKTNHQKTLSSSLHHELIVFWWFVFLCVFLFLRFRSCACWVMSFCNSISTTPKPQKEKNTQKNKPPEDPM